MEEGREKNEKMEEEGVWFPSVLQETCGLNPTSLFHCICIGGSRKRKQHDGEPVSDHLHLPQTSCRRATRNVHAQVCWFSGAKQETSVSRRGGVFLKKKILYIRR